MLGPQTANLGSSVTSYGIEAIAYGWSRPFGSSKMEQPAGHGRLMAARGYDSAFVSTRIDPFGVPLSGC